MAQLVLGIGTSHTPMLNAPPEDWPRFYERDSKRTNLLDTEGRLTTYEKQLKHAPPGIIDERSWAYWNVVIGRYPTPPMPRRMIPDRR